MTPANYLRDLLTAPDGCGRTFRAYYDVPKGEGRRLVIPDIHGCAETLEALLDEIELTRADQLFFLGDYVDRGPYHARVMDKVMQLMRDGYNVFPLRGNHEDMLLEAVQSAEQGIAVEAEALPQLLNGENQVHPTYRRFLANLPYYYRLDEYYLVHAGFAFYEAEPFEVYDEMLWIRQPEIDLQQTGGRSIVHGHTPMPLKAITQRIRMRAPLIALDNGCVFKGMHPDVGHLLCLDLDTLELYIHGCRDDVRRLP